MIPFHATHVHDREKREYRDYMLSRKQQTEAASLLPDQQYHFDSEWRNKNLDPNAQDFTIYFKEPITHVSSVMMQTLRLPNVVNTIRTGNNSFSWQEKDDDEIYTVLIPSKQYTVDELLSALMIEVSNLNRKGVSNNPFFMSYRYNTNTSDIQLMNWQFAALSADPFTTTTNSSILTVQYSAVAPFLPITTGEQVLFENTSIQDLNNNIFTVLATGASSFTIDSGILAGNSTVSLGGNSCRMGRLVSFKLIHTTSSFLPMIGFPSHNSGQPVHNLQPIFWTAIGNLDHNHSCVVQGDQTYSNFVRQVAFTSQDGIFQVHDVERVETLDSSHARVSFRPNRSNRHRLEQLKLITDVATLQLSAIDAPNDMALKKEDQIKVICKSKFDFQVSATLLQDVVMAPLITCVVNMSPRISSLSFVDTLVSWTHPKLGFSFSHSNDPSHFLVVLLNPLFMHVQLPDWEDPTQSGSNPHLQMSHTLLSAKLDSSPDSFIFVDQSVQSFQLPKLSTLNRLRLRLIFPNAEGLNLKNFNYSGTLIFKRRRHVILDS